MEGEGERGRERERERERSKHFMKIYFSGIAMNVVDFVQILDV